jgi:hypothetical protein
MQRTLKRELKVLEIVKREAIRISHCRAFNQLDVVLLGTSLFPGCGPWLASSLCKVGTTVAAAQLSRVHLGAERLACQCEFSENKRGRTVLSGKVSLAPIRSVAFGEL